MPESGPGSIAGSGPRVLAYFVDAIIAGLIALPVDEHDRAWASITIFAVMTIVLLAVTGQTIGMRLVKLRVIPVGRLRFPWAVATVIRTVLLCAFVPAVIFDRDSRGLHDRLSGTAVVRI